jgi:2-polyprenyl-3-methyl-5-hydroxy-6-metoxy-1,4-benzoquinol methylase
MRVLEEMVTMVRNRMRREEVYSAPDFWNRKAERHQGDAVSMWPNNALNAHYHREQLDLLGEMLPDVNGVSILDLGCGTGRISRHLASRGARVLGIDFAEKAIRIAREQSDGTNPRFEVRSMFELGESARYDVVVSWGSVAIACRNADELKQVLTSLHRALVPGGRLLLLEPVHRGPLHRVLNLSVREFAGAITQVGLDLQQARAMHFVPARVALAYLPWPAGLTSVGYHLGQAVMKRLPTSGWGDYTAFYAVKPAGGHAA